MKLLITLIFALIVAEPEAAQDQWLTNFKDAQKQAMEKKRPMLVVFGAEWCGPCKMLEKEMERAEVKEKLAGWTCVHLDIDHTPGAAALMGGAGAIPHLKVMSATGRTIASQTGFMKGEELIKWLAENFDEAIAGAGEELTAGGVPSAADLAKLIDYLRQPEAALREAAIKRLMAHRAVAAQSVVEAMAKGNLASRLSALELLSAWKAPVEGIDPWRSETVSTQRIAKLRDWAKAAASTTRPTDKAGAMAPADLQQARLEIARLLETADDAEAQTIRERLARLGAAIAGEVREQLAVAQKESARARLGALRYRLAMSDALALAWPDGADRLASADQSSRRAAVMELTKQATSADAQLLLELFGDPDPLVRQMSLRTLASVAGDEATGALMGLLEDKDVNVRTEVLKQLTEKPVAAVVGKVGEYALAEKNPELVVQSVRMFRAAKGSEARQVLLKLTGHESWRVRAEAVEALAEMINDYQGRRQADPETQAVIMKLLKDKDGFVVSRAAMALQQIDIGGSLDEVMKAVEAHPELAVEVLDRLGKNENMNDRVLPYLIKLSGHAEPAVRAAAIKGLGTQAAAGAQQIAKALRDRDERVRTAAAEATFAAMEELRPKDGVIRKTKRRYFVGSREQVEERVDTSQWLVDFRSGKNRPAWLAGTADDLQKMLDSSSAPQRINAAQALVALGKEARSLPMLLAAAKSDEHARAAAGRVLPWLLIEKRLEVFGQLLALGGDDNQQAHLARGMAQMPDQRVRKPLWEMLAAKDVSTAVITSVQQALLTLYLTENYYNLQNVPKAMLTEAIRETRERAAGGSDTQRAVAMAILLTASAQDAAEIAGKIFDDPASGELLRDDALLVVLKASERAEGTKRAVEALASKLEPQRALGLAYLCDDEERLTEMRLGASLSYTHVYESFSPDARPNLASPAGLKEETLRPFLKVGGKQGAQAGYLLALMGVADGMEFLLAQWRQDVEQENWRRLVYRAVGALNDEKYVPVLEEMYSKMSKDDWRMREFYWSIRSMTGPKILALRKKIRDEVGMDNLK